MTAFRLAMVDLLKSSGLRTIAICAIASMFGLSGALAADRTVCFEIELEDARPLWLCPDANSPGVRRPCNGYEVGATTYDTTDITGFFYEVWDKDSSPEYDDYIGTWIMGGTGRRCVTFPWEGESYQYGEANPDVYLVLTPNVRAPAGGPVAKALDGSGAPHPNVSWRNEANGWYSNCTAGADCDIGGSPTAVLVPNLVATGTLNAALLGLDTAQRALQLYDTAINDHSDIFIWIDEEANYTGNGYCDSNPDAFACAWGYSNMHVSVDGAVRAYDLNHEMGHLFHAREIGAMLDPDYMFAGNPGWSYDKKEYQKAATIEGWAMYVGTVSWLDPEDQSLTGPPANPGTHPPFAGFPANLEDPAITAVVTCYAGRLIPHQVAKAFWDMDDARQDVGPSGGPNAGREDTANLSTKFLLNQWSDFPPGWWNRTKGESDADGVNLRDYAFNAPLGNLSTFLEMNCLEDQDDG